VSCFTYERRGPDGAGPLPPARWPTRALATRWRALERIAEDLNHNEDDAGLSETRAPDPGFVPYAYEWVAGDDLAEMLADDTEMTGGDFVRHVKQCIDLLRQIGDVARRRSVTSPLRPGDPWGRAASGPPDVDLAGDDSDLAAVAASRRGALV